MTRIGRAYLTRVVGLIAATLPVVARGQAPPTRVIPRAEIPVMFRESLAVRGVARQTDKRVDTVRASPAGLSLATNQVVALHVGVRPTFVAGPAVPPSAAAPGRSPASVASSRIDFAHFILPTRYLATDAEAKTTMVLRPIYATGTRLTFDPSTQRFRGVLLIGLEDSVAPSEFVKLAKPIEFQFPGDANTMNPGTVTITHTNLPLDSIVVTAPQAAVLDSVLIHIIPQLDPRGVNVSMPVAPALIFPKGVSQIQGLGLENAAVVIEVVGARVRDPLVVTLTATNGSFESLQVTVGQSGATTARLRSRGTGPVTMSAMASGYVPANGSVSFVFPWMFLIAALAGGAAGGMIKWSNGSVRTGAAAMSMAGRGAAVGIVAAVVYYAIRVNLLPVTIDIQYLNEAAVFALALVGGLLGIKAPASA